MSKHEETGSILDDLIKGERGGTEKEKEIEKWMGNDLAGSKNVSVSANWRYEIEKRWDLAFNTVDIEDENKVSRTITGGNYEEPETGDVVDIEAEIRQEVPEPVLGAPDEIKSQKRIFIGIDCSGSMGTGAIWTAIEQIDSLMEDMPKGTIIEVDVCYWSDNIANRSYKCGREGLTRVLPRNNNQIPVSMGSTPFSSCVAGLEMFRNKDKYDLLFIFTDAWFNKDDSIYKSATLDKAISSGRLVWALVVVDGTEDGMLDRYLNPYDSSWKKNCIKLPATYNSITRETKMKDDEEIAKKENRLSKEEIERIKQSLYKEERDDYKGGRDDKSTAKNDEGDESEENEGEKIKKEESGKDKKDKKDEKNGEDSEDKKDEKDSKNKKERKDGGSGGEENQEDYDPDEERIIDINIKDEDTDEAAPIRPEGYEDEDTEPENGEKREKKRRKTGESIGGQQSGGGKNKEDEDETDVVEFDVKPPKESEGSGSGGGQSGTKPDDYEPKVLEVDMDDMKILSKFHVNREDI